MNQIVLYAFLGTGFTFLMTTLGAAVVFLLGKNINDTLERIFAGFAAGVMMAASVWSLLLPAIDEAEKAGSAGWIPAGGGFLIGAVFLFLVQIKLEKRGHMNKSLFVTAVTLHNIPEGMAVGLAFALAVTASADTALFAAATALAFGIGIQNFPEGAAISLPLYRDGIKKSRAFAIGTMTGIVEPVFGVLAAMCASLVSPLMPWLLSFAAGAMVYVVAEELIPRANENGKTCGSIGVIAGFLIMMLLDVALS